MKNLRINNFPLCLSIDRTTLKIIAIITMIIDHIGVLFFPEIKLFRIIGRIAFPVFVYQLVEGFEKTSNLKKYFCRLAIFALISELIYDITFWDSVFFWESQNVYFELILCLTALVVLKKTENKSILLRWLGFFSICFVAIFSRADYNAYGVILAGLFYLYKGNVFVYTLGLSLISYLFYPFPESVQIFGVISLIFIGMYEYNPNKSCKKLAKPLQILFYTFYPLHILILYVVKTLLA